MLFNFIRFCKYSLISIAIVAALFDDHLLLRGSEDPILSGMTAKCSLQQQLIELNNDDDDDHLRKCRAYLSFSEPLCEVQQQLRVSRLGGHDR